MARITKVFDHLSFNKFVEVDNSFLEGKSAGKGLFATKKFEVGDIVCTFGGQLVDYNEAKYLPPHNIANFENGKGFKIVGDDVFGDKGNFCNSIHPDQNIQQNARYAMRTKKFLQNNRGVFFIIATMEIKIDDEIIVDYSDGYWLACAEWDKCPKYKSADVIAREKRLAKWKGEEYIQPTQAPPHHTDGESSDDASEDEFDGKIGKSHENPVVLGAEHDEVEMDLGECKLLCVVLLCILNNLCFLDQATFQTRRRLPRAWL